ncbi:hypothetical protein Trydic_g5610 [Trypoxylus dichotomus]
MFGLWYLILISQLDSAFAQINITDYYKNNSDILLAVCEQEYEQNYRICGGTLIDGIWLLTSQTCRSTKRLDSLLVAVFESIFDRQRESTLSERYLQKWIAHQNYELSPQIIKNDVALLLLEDVYRIYEHKKIVKLPTKELFEASGMEKNNTQQRCNFLFWPMDTFNWQTHLRFIYLRSASIRVIPRNICRTMVIDMVISREQFCGRFSEEEPVLEGLSSGPLICFKLQFAVYTTKTFDREGKLVLVFTRLDYFQEYIEGITHTSAYIDSFPEAEERVFKESIDDLVLSGTVIQPTSTGIFVSLLIAAFHLYFTEIYS